jgi:nitrogen regulatory protein PII
MAAGHGPSPFLHEQRDSMKLITGVVRPDKIDAVKAALERVRAGDITVAEVRDHAPQDYETTVWRGHEYNLGFSPKMEIKIVVHDDAVDEVVAAIIRTARTGAAGDGHVAVASLEHRYSIRTGERDIS